MSSGAFALYIDQVAGGGSGAMIRRVIPLPPTSGGDAINFNQGRLSLAYDDFGSSLPAIVNVRIINTTGVRLSTTLTLSPGRTLVSDIQADDLLASFEVGSGTPVLLSRHWSSIAIEDSYLKLGAVLSDTRCRPAATPVGLRAPGSCRTGAC